jgi:hypothetical protein
MAPICSSTSENNAVIHSTVVMRLSSQGKDVPQTSVEESSDDRKPKNAHCGGFYSPILLEQFARNCYENEDGIEASPSHSPIFMEGGEAPLHDR